MRKIIAAAAAFALITVSVSAEKLIPQVKRDYTFAGDRYSVSELDTDGKNFVGILAGRIAVSTDFQNWAVNEEIEDVTAIYYLKDRFCAVGGGVTYTSADGSVWDKYENNLPEAPTYDKSAKLNGSVVTFTADKTYQTYDGIEWREVPDVPPGVDIYIVNNLFFMESTGYMRGIYWSENGERFNKTELPQYTESYGPFNLRYYGGKYYVQDYWREIDEAYNYQYSSEDLITWNEEIVVRGDDISPQASQYVSINGELHALTNNGNDFVYSDRVWENGIYEMSTEAGSNPPFVHYRISEKGILAWSTSQNSYYIPYNGDMITYHGLDRKWANLFESDGKIYVSCLSQNVYMNDNDSWVKSDKEYTYWNKESTAENGSITLTTEFIERGSWATHPDNEEITGVITYPDGKTENVVYEDAKGDYVRLVGLNGSFMMYGFSSQGMCISADGVNRYELIELPEYDGGDIVSNSEKIYYMGSSHVINSIEKSQLQNVKIPKTIKVKLNGTYLSFITPPVVEAGRTLVSIRFLFERMGAVVDWNDVDKSCTITYGDKTVTVQIDNKTAIVNGEAKELDVPARLINEKTMLPMRFISEQFGFNVEYNEAEHIAEVNV